jgi:hypothetical protein
MAEVCGHLSEMVEIVDDFFKFLGPELKAVTGVRGKRLAHPAVLLTHSAGPCMIWMQETIVLQGWCLI